MTDRTLEDEYQALIEWAEARGLQPQELMSVCSVTIGRVIAALIQEKGLSIEQAQALAQQAQWGLIRGAGLDGDDAAGGTKH